ncbi:undecaprenyldiphospho-muramoylpentapeptide beta-N-acetylglucosaminyltransferase [soil metagenome]
MSTTNRETKRVVIACGGTGGHLFPGIAVAEELQRAGHETLALISQKNIDALATKGYDAIRFETLEAIAMPRLLSVGMPKFVLRFWRARNAARRIVQDFAPHAVMGMGGFTSMPPVMAGRSLGARTFIHESNAFPGKANRLTARFCDEILLGFEECARFFPGRTTRAVGTPVRGALTGPRPSAAEARAHFGLDPARMTLLVMGGSQGARAVNRAVCQALSHFKSAALQILHFSGPADFAEVQHAYRGMAVRHHVGEFCSEMGTAYAAADLALSRAGASSLAELAICGLPAILVPYPYAANDHQLRNAEIFAARNAALLLEERNLSTCSLSKMVNDLVASPDILADVAANCRAAATPDAAAQIARLVAA